MSNIHWQIEAKKRRQKKYQQWWDNIERLEAELQSEPSPPPPSWVEPENTLPYKVGCWPISSNRHHHFNDYYLNYLSEQFVKGKYPGLSMHSCGEIHPIEYHIPSGTKIYRHLISDFIGLTGAAARYATLDKERTFCLKDLAASIGVEYENPPICCGLRQTPFDRHSYERCPERLFRLHRIHNDMVCMKQCPEIFDPSSNAATLNCGDSASCTHKS